MDSRCRSTSCSSRVGSFFSAACLFLLFSALRRSCGGVRLLGRIVSPRCGQIANAGAVEREERAQVQERAALLSHPVQGGGSAGQACCCFCVGLPLISLLAKVFWRAYTPALVRALFVNGAVFLAFEISSRKIKEQRNKK